MVISGTTAVTNANVLSGSIFEFVKRPSRVSVAVIAINVAINGGNLFSFLVSDVTVARDAQVFGDLITTSGNTPQGPNWPEDFLIQNEPALPGDRMVLSITRAAGTIAWAVILTEVA